ncbi:ethylbenzene dehydrogenase-related protein [Colwellia psychrerythraea]|uniref:Cytochrome c-552/DMSO reductase-like, heme-binding domain-containing protein n=1 Tax=Colwellia psychrerythraea TaxID=28229 RepID=A0A099L0G8_COLPS|nr:ethylbenzene dehydrogenase-related protein [Colwellia psychrerythraea]KGJ95935.1 Cytochrome c-552/DMSO reductase-like, heme-binding domain-containing protein [Colwellia psychrerythraea]
MKNLLLFSLLFLLLSEQSFAARMVIEAKHSPNPINIDGKKDAHWNLVKPLTVKLNELPYEPNNGYLGLKETSIEISSLYDSEYVYFLFRWYDPTISLARFPWEKSQNGSWIKLSNLDHTLHENTYYEDKLAIYWDINERGFIKKGCDKSCHMQEEGMLEGIKDTSSGRHYTKNDGETIDEWHWKATRTNSLKQMDDGYVDNEHETNNKWGRHIDNPHSGGYYANKNKTNMPAWMNGPEVKPSPDWILDSKKVPFVDTFKAGDRIGGIVIAPFEQARADVTARGIWFDDHWQLEIKRKRITHHQDSATQDVQFDNLHKAYYFGVTAFDNSQINHLYHKKSIKLIFKQ